MRLHGFKSRRKPRARRTVVLSLGLILIFTIALASIYIVRTADIFRIQDVSVTGVEETDSDIVRAAVEDSVSKTFIAHLFGDTSYFAWQEDITVEHHAFANITITKNMFERSVVISAEPHRRFAVWCSGEIVEEFDRLQEHECWWVNYEGEILEKTLIPDGRLVRKIIERTDGNWSLGAVVLRPELFGTLVSIITRITSEDIRITHGVVDAITEEITLYLPDDKYLIFSLRFNPNQNIDALMALLRATPLSEISSVDVSVPGKLYLKRI